ncbi:MAG: hypothetical protein RIS64_2216 [Bacteroidota bacterium]
MNGLKKKINRCLKILDLCKLKKGTRIVRMFTKEAPFVNIRTIRVLDDDKKIEINISII